MEKNLPGRRDPYKRRISLKREHSLHIITPVPKHEICRDVVHVSVSYRSLFVSLVYGVSPSFLLADPARSLPVLPERRPHTGRDTPRHRDHRYGGRRRTFCDCAQRRELRQIRDSPATVRRHSDCQRRCERLRDIHWFARRPGSSVGVRLF